MLHGARREPREVVELAEQAIAAYRVVGHTLRATEVEDWLDARPEPGAP